MADYSSSHFQAINRSLLIPEDIEATRSATEAGSMYEDFESELNPVDPYFQPHTGLFLRNNGRPYSVYVPHGIQSKGPAVIVFPESGIHAEDFIDEEWRELSEKYSVTIIALQSDHWDIDNPGLEFDFANSVVRSEFFDRATADICESYIYPMGFGDGAYIASAFAITYSATFPAFAAYGNCSIDTDLLETLRSLPSDGVKTKKKTEVSLPAFIINTDNSENAIVNYLREINNAEDQGLFNTFGNVFIEKARPGAYFVNDQPIAEVWSGNSKNVIAKSRREIVEAMLQFVLRYARWGGAKNNHLRHKRTQGETGVQRVYQEIDGLKRFFDIYTPSCYREQERKSYPLVLAIHGYSCNAEYFEQTSDWQRVAEERGFFVVFPSAYPRPVRMAPFCLPAWQAGYMEGRGSESDIPYFENLIQYMKDNYLIDSGRIYAAGHSNGSQMTQLLSREMPEVFAAFAPSGALAGRNADDVIPFQDNYERPVWFVMGEYDLFNPELTEGSLAEATLKQYCAINHVTSDFTNCYENGIYSHMVIRNGNHAPMIRYTIMKGCPHTYTPEMAQMTWDEFFCHFRRNEDGSVSYFG